MTELLQSVNLVHRLDAGFSKEVPAGWVGQGGETQGAGTRDQWKAGLAEEMANTGVVILHRLCFSSRGFRKLSSVQRCIKLVYLVLSCKTVLAHIEFLDA